MKKTSAYEVIQKLKLVFTIFGLADEIVSDNGPPFGSYEFTHYCNLNGIKLTHSPPYHPQSNGEAEVAVRVAKHSLKKISIDSNTKNKPIESIIQNFLLKYRMTPTTVTGKSPANLIFNFKPKSLLDLLYKRQMKVVREVEQPIKRKTKPIPVKNNGIKEITTYKPNEIVSYQLVANNFIKWVAAKNCEKNI